MKRYSFFIAAFILLSHLVFGQLPERVVQTRSLVIMDLPLVQVDGFLVRGDWEEKADFIQKNLSLIGIDAIAYMHNDDWAASPSLKDQFSVYKKNEKRCSYFRHGN